VRVLRDTAEGFWVAACPSADIVVVGHEYVTDGVVVNAVRRDAGD
jgi:membrane fusion protein, multidrug efflux system